MDRRSFMKIFGVAAAGAAVAPMTIAKQVLEETPKKEFILDKIPGALSAYGVKQLSSKATNCMTIRRSTDNMQFTITFKHLESDENFKVVKEFIGTSDVYCVKWFDQSGNNQHMYQQNMLEQPKIIERGEALEGIEVGGGTNMKTMIIHDGDLSEHRKEIEDSLNDDIF